MKPGRQSQGGREDGKGRKIFSRSSNNSKAKEKGRGHRKETARRVKLFSLTKRNREKVRRQKLMMMAPYIEIFFAFFFCLRSVCFCWQTFDDFPAHTYTHTHCWNRGGDWGVWQARPGVESCFNVNDISLQDTTGERDGDGAVC